MQFSLQPTENVNHIDVFITRKASKAQNAVLAALLTRHAAVVSTVVMLHFVHTHKHTQKLSHNYNYVWPLCLQSVMKETLIK